MKKSLEKLIGCEIEHKTFGKGKILSYKLIENNCTINVRFESNETHTLGLATWYLKKRCPQIELVLFKLKNNKINEKTDNIKKCLLCSNTTVSEEHLLCPACYRLYKNKKLFLEISTNDNSIKLLDATYEGRLECDDGHIVKSQAERDIDNYLFEKNIKHGYETILPIYDNGKRIELRPDFCIFDGNEKIYIEYWGIENDQIYENKKEFKMPLYKKAGITLINMYKRTDMRNIRASLEDKLKHYKKGHINFEE